MTFRLLISLTILLTISTATIYAAMTVECTHEAMSIDIEMNSSNNVTFYIGNSLNNSCQLTQNGTHNSGSASYDTCDIERSDNDTYIIYTVKVINFLNSSANINRDPTHQYNVECYLERDVNTSLLSNLNVSRMATINETIEDTGQFTISLDIFPTDQYMSKYISSDFPLEYTIRDNVFVAISLDTTNGDVMLVPQDCWASYTIDYSAATKHYLFKDRCGTDTTFGQLHNDNTTFEFYFQAFQFENDVQAVYLFCKVIICEFTSSSSECSFGCDGNRKKRSIYEQQNRRRKRDLTADISVDGELKEYIISTDRLIFLTPNENTGKASSSLSQTTIGLLGGVIGVLLVLTFLFVLYFKIRMNKLSCNGYRFGTEIIKREWKKSRKEHY